MSVRPAGVDLQHRPFDDQAEIVADVPPEERTEPTRYLAAEIAKAVGYRSVTCRGSG
ncbi:hypothetical protein [Streptomyces sp. NPDC003710]